MLTKSITKKEAMALRCEPLPDLVARIIAPASDDDVSQLPLGPTIMCLLDERQFVIAFGDILAGGSDGAPWFYDHWSEAAADLTHLHIGFHIKPSVIL